MIPEDFQGKIPSVSFYKLKFQPIQWKILIKVNIGTKVSYLKLKQNSFEILCEEENVKIITVAQFKVMQIFRLKEYSFY